MPEAFIGRPPRPPEDRFWEKVDASGDCWEWTAAKVRGYGVFREGGMGSKNVKAYRFAWEQLVGPIPDGLQIDHRCFNTSCVNPDHLDVVTIQENNARRRWSAHHALSAKTHCPRGHEYAGPNLVMDGGSRKCRICIRFNSGNRRRARARATATAAQEAA